MNAVNPLRPSVHILPTFLIFLLLFPQHHPISVLASPPPSDATLRSASRAADIRLSATSEANIAYFIQIAESTADHLPRLLRRLHHPNNVYAVHFDMKMGADLIASVKTVLFAASPHFRENVHFMPSELITYRGVSMVLNTINAMKFLLEKNGSWHYFINLSGSDYPLVTPQLQRQLLGKHISHAFNFATFSGRNQWVDNVRYRMQHFYVDEALSFSNGPSQVVQSSQKNPLAGMMHFQYANSEAWMINSRAFCRFVVTDGYARKMLLTFAYSVEASEHYFASLLWNHPKFNRTIVPRAMRHVVWMHEGRHAGQHPFLIDERGGDGEFTFKSVVETSPNFFIRKFQQANSPLMDYIDRRMEDAERIRGVTTLYNWVTSVAIEDHKAKPPLRDVASL